MPSDNDTRGRWPLKRLLGLGFGVALIAGCGELAGFDMSDVVAFARAAGIPTLPDAPELGQQPIIPQDPGINGKAVPLTLAYTSDVHSRVDPFPDDFYYRVYAGKGGYARLATMVANVRRSHPNTLVMDSGDYLQGTPYFNWFKGEVEMKAMSMVGYDAATIGNHEFDNGFQALFRLLPLFKGPLIATNVSSDPALSVPYRVLQAGPLRVGVFGLLAKADGLITPNHFAPARYHDPIATARAAVAKLQHEADVIVALSHMGTVPPWSDEDEGHPECGESCELPEPAITDEVVAERVPGIDVILSGHTHVMIKRPKVIRSGSHRTLIVSPGYGGGYLGVLTAEVRDGDIVRFDNNLVPVDRAAAPDARVESLIAPYRAKLDQSMKDVIGYAVGDFRRYGGKDTESSLNNLIADATFLGARRVDPAVDFAMSSSGTPRNHILAGPIQQEEVFFALPFDSQIVVVDVPGEMIPDLLQLRRRASEPKRHAIANASYAIDPRNDQISRIVINGKPFNPRRTYRVAVTDYMSEGGSGFAMLPGLPRRDTGIIQRDALLDLVKREKQLKPSLGRIRFLTGRDLQAVP